MLPGTVRGKYPLTWTRWAALGWRAATLPASSAPSRFWPRTRACPCSINRTPEPQSRRWKGGWSRKRKTAARNYRTFCGATTTTRRKAASSRRRGFPRWPPCCWRCRGTKSRTRSRTPSPAPSPCATSRRTCSPSWRCTLTSSASSSRPTARSSRR